MIMANSNSLYLFLFFTLAIVDAQLYTPYTFFNSYPLGSTSSSSSPPSPPLTSLSSSPSPSPSSSISSDTSPSPSPISSDSSPSPSPISSDSSPSPSPSSMSSSSSPSPSPSPSSYGEAVEMSIGALDTFSSISLPPSSSPSPSPSPASSATLSCNSASFKAKIGVCLNYTAVDNLPSPSIIVQLLKTHNIPRVRLFSPDSTILPAFKGSGIDLMIGIPNEKLAFLSSASLDAVVNWLSSNIFASVDQNQVTYLAVGDNVLQKVSDVPNLVPAMRNLHMALQSLDVDDQILITAPQAISSILRVTFPPSAAVFDADLLPVVEPLLRFLSDTGAPLAVNLQPFETYVDNALKVALNYVLFEANQPLFRDEGKAYTNLFDASVDAAAAAMAKLGFGNVPVVVSETGWPTSGNREATTEKAAAYAQGIMNKAASGVGTPARPDCAVEVFFSNMFDQSGRGGKEYEKHYGVFKVDGSLAFNISFAIPSE
ncbi:hypothetical protein Cni_G12573 [Canna indica]|uniref:Glucan endo-1,3-beta-D-glucosidase n=1 Tax=Canna indica TaxID=4628 RepID=A0AAQ3QC96_9LILI|nr:hypothetical protein Cni_G12573 [Canna indica]